MNDLLKRLGVGVLIGLAVTMIVGLVVDKLPAVSKFLDKYEYLSYDSRMILNKTPLKDWGIILTGLMHIMVN